MTTMHQNVFAIKSSSVRKVEVVPGSLVVTKGQPSDGAVNMVEIK